MTGHELYETERPTLEALLGYAPPWEELTPWRQEGWRATAREYVAKRLQDEEADARMEDDGAPALH